MKDPMTPSARPPQHGFKPMSHLQGHDKRGLLLVVGVHKVPVAILAQHVGLQGQMQVAMAGRPELLPPHIRQHSPVDALTMSQSVLVTFICHLHPCLLASQFAVIL